MNMVFASQNKILAVQAQNGLMVLDVSTRKRIFYRTGGCGYSKVALSSDGNILAFEQFGTYTCDHGTKVLLWNLAADRMITSINIYDGAVAEMTLSTDGRMLATVDSRDTVRLREVATGRRYRGIPVGTLSGLTFSPDGSLLATAGGDGTVRLWDVATQQQIGPSIKAGGVSALAFSPAATLLTTLGPNHAVRQWDVTFPSRLPNAMCSIAGHSLTPSEWKVHIPSEPYRRLCS